MFARRLVRRRGKVLIAAPAPATMRDDHALIRLLKVMNQLASLIVVDSSPDWHLQHNLVARAARAVRALAVPPSLTLVLRVVPKNESACCVAGSTPSRRPRRGHHRRPRVRPSARTSRAGKPCIRLPPSPALIRILASSINIFLFQCSQSFISRTTFPPAFLIEHAAAVPYSATRSPNCAHSQLLLTTQAPAPRSARLHLISPHTPRFVLRSPDQTMHARPLVRWANHACMVCVTRGERL